MILYAQKSGDIKRKNKRAKKLEVKLWNWKIFKRFQDSTGNSRNKEEILGLLIKARYNPQSEC